MQAFAAKLSISEIDPFGEALFYSMLVSTSQTPSGLTAGTPGLPGSRDQRWRNIGANSNSICQERYSEALRLHATGSGLRAGSPESGVRKIRRGDLGR